MPKRQVWISDNSNIKYQRIKSSFVEAMQQQTKEQKINYYDFLLVAKKLSFRFEESSHLMALKNYFAKNKNNVVLKKMADLLCISQESLHAQEDKIIVKFNVPDTQFAPIKEETHEDEEYDGLSEEDVKNQLFQKIGNNSWDEEERELNEKMAVILSIKVDEMEKKIQTLISEKESSNLITLLSEQENIQINYEQFKGVILSILEQSKDKIKISEDDIKTIYYVLDEGQKGSIAANDIKQLKDVHGVSSKLKDFYRARINKEMVKNTLFKLGKVKNNTIQIYQVKNASLLEFENMEKSIVEDSGFIRAMPKLKQVKIPHFGPLKGAANANKQRQTLPARMTEKLPNSQISLERDKIEKILRHSKQQKRKDKSGDTVASKLRSLFIHKVILPREKMLEEEKERYLASKVAPSDLFVRSHKNH